MCRLLLKTNFRNEDFSLFNEGLYSMKKGGPDASHIKVIDNIGFGHNRLSILDIRDIADQPMIINNNIILFNGEIYNFRELKEKYGLETETEGDTEIILLLYNKIGDEVFNELEGEFAIVIYDSDLHKIKLVRDRLGVKQLYFYFKEDLIISSEIKGILPFLNEKRVNKQGIEEWLTYGYPINGTTMFKDIYKLIPNHIMEYDLKNYHLDIKELKPLVLENKTLFENLEYSVKSRMISDVPISCTLSGGIDSSIVAYLMSKNSDKPIKTYTVGFEGVENEFKEAKKVSEFIGSVHTELEIPMSWVLEEIDNILLAMEEPIDRGSLIPTYFLAKVINEKVTLIGEGSDEIFGGYSRHEWLFNHPKVTFDEYFERQLRAFDTEIKPTIKGNLSDDLNKALEFDLSCEIPNYHTIRIDKCMMSEGKEARVPFLDPRITQYVNTSFNQKQNPRKKILRDEFKNILPEWLTDRPKKALKFPFDKIVILPEVEKLIKEKSKIFDKELVNELYKNINSSKNAARDLWNIFLFKKWKKIFHL